MSEGSIHRAFTPVLFSSSHYRLRAFLFLNMTCEGISLPNNNLAVVAAQEDFLSTHYAADSSADFVLNIYHFIKFALQCTTLVHSRPGSWKPYLNAQRARTARPHQRTAPGRVISNSSSHRWV